MKQRDSYVDVAKGICILLIVCIHTEVFSVIGMPFTFIAVPMFFFMSGFFDRSEKPFVQWFPKSIKTLILPAVIWVILGYLYLNILTYAKEHVFLNFSFDIYSPCKTNGPAWFLFALLFAKIIVWTLCKTPLHKYFILILTYLIGYLGSTYQMPFLLDEGLAAVPLYYTGKLIYPYMYKVKENRNLFFVGIVGIYLIISHYVYYTIVPMQNGCYQPYFLLGIVTVETTFFVVLFLSSKIKNCVLFESLGRRSLGIMLLHAPMCHTAAVILNRVFEKESTIWIISFLNAYIIVIVLSYYLTVFIERYCPILFGKNESH